MRTLWNSNPLSSLFTNYFPHSTLKGCDNLNNSFFFDSYIKNLLSATLLPKKSISIFFASPASCFPSSADHPRRTSVTCCSTFSPSTISCPNHPHWLSFSPYGTALVNLPAPPILSLSAPHSGTSCVSGSARLPVSACLYGSWH